MDRWKEGGKPINYINKYFISIYASSSSTLDITLSESCIARICIRTKAAGSSMVGFIPRVFSLKLGVKAGYTNQAPKQN